MGLSPGRDAGLRLASRTCRWLAPWLCPSRLSRVWNAPSDPAEHGKGPEFSALIHTLDLLLPIIDFGQQIAFTPTGVYQWLSYLLIAADWVRATTVAAVSHGPSAVNSARLHSCSPSGARRVLVVRSQLVAAWRSNRAALHGRANVA
jgi:hypothetical protein